MPDLSRSCASSSFWLKACYLGVDLEFEVALDQVFDGFEAHEAAGAAEAVERVPWSAAGTDECLFFVFALRKHLSDHSVEVFEVWLAPQPTQDALLALVRILDHLDDLFLGRLVAQHSLSRSLPIR